MGEQGGLRTGWLAAFGTEGYDGEPPLLEELGINFEHIRTKVSRAIIATGEAPHMWMPTTHPNVFLQPNP
jgi:hypothetical protein